MCQGGLSDGTWHQPAWDRAPTHEGMWAKQVASQKQPKPPQLEAGAKPEAQAPQERQEQGISEGHSPGVFLSFLSVLKNSGCKSFCVFGFNFCCCPTVIYAFKI